MGTEEFSKLKDCATDVDEKTVSEIESETVAFNPVDETETIEEKLENLPLPQPFKQKLDGSHIFYARKANRNHRITKEQAEKYLSLGDMVTQGDGMCLIDLDKRTIRYYVEQILSNYSLSPFSRMMTNVFYGIGVVLFFSVISALKSGFDQESIDKLQKSVISEIQEKCSNDRSAPFSESLAFPRNQTGSGSVEVKNIRKLGE